MSEDKKPGEFRVWGRSSPSQMKTWDTCERRWAWEKIFGKDSGSNAAAERGGEIHAVLEGWLAENYDLPQQDEKHAKPPPDNLPELHDKWWDHLAPTVAWAGVFLSDKVVLSVELYVETEQGRGYVDLVVLDPATDTLYIIDWKTKGRNFTYAASREDLLEKDWQTRFYPPLVLDKHPAGRVVFMHVNILRDRSTKPRIVEVDVTDRIEEYRERYSRRHERMRVSSLQQNPADYAPSTESCRLYYPKGCPFKRDCADLGLAIPGEGSISSASFFSDISLARTESVPTIDTQQKEPIMATLADTLAARKTTDRTMVDTDLDKSHDTVFLLSCRPVGIPCPTLDALLDDTDIPEWICKRFNDVDFATADYGRGAKYALKELASRIDDGKYELPPFVYVSQHSKLGQAFDSCAHIFDVTIVVSTA